MRFSYRMFLGLSVLAGSGLLPLPASRTRQPFGGGGRVPSRARPRVFDPPPPLPPPSPPSPPTAYPPPLLPPPPPPPTPPDPLVGTHEVAASTAAV